MQPSSKGSVQESLFWQYQLFSSNLRRDTKWTSLISSHVMSSPIVGDVICYQWRKQHLIYVLSTFNSSCITSCHFFSMPVCSSHHYRWIYIYIYFLVTHMLGIVQSGYSSFASEIDSGLLPWISCFWSESSVMAMSCHANCLCAREAGKKVKQMKTFVVSSRKVEENF